MDIKQKLIVIGKLGMGLAAFTLLLAGCGGGSTAATTATSGAAVAGVTTPSKVSVVTTN